MGKRIKLSVGADPIKINEVTLLFVVLLSLVEFEKLTESESQDNYVVIEHYECAICSSTTPSTAERPMGMVSLMQSTCGMCCC